MVIYLVKGFPEYAATSLADAQSLLTALADPGTETNSATIDRVMGKLPPLYQSDTGEAITLSSIDDTGGTISSWVTDAGTTLQLGLGDPDPHNAQVYAQINADGFTIGATTRTASLALNSTALEAALAGWAPRPPRRPYTPFTLQIQKTTSGVTETVGMFTVQVFPGVLQGARTDLSPATYLTAAQIAAGYQPLDADLTAIAALTTASYGRSLLTLSALLGNNTQEVAAAGTTTLAWDAIKPIHTEVVTITGAAGTYKIVIPTANRQAGDLILLRVEVPATIGIVADIRNATAGGTQLLQYTTAATDDPNLFILCRYNGTSFTRLFSLAA